MSVDDLLIEIRSTIEQRVRARIAKEISVIVEDEAARMHRIVIEVRVPERFK